MSSGGGGWGGRRAAAASCERCSTRRRGAAGCAPTPGRPLAAGTACPLAGWLAGWLAAALACCAGTQCGRRPDLLPLPPLTWGAVQLHAHGARHRAVVVRPLAASHAQQPRLLAHPRRVARRHPLQVVAGGLWGVERHACAGKQVAGGWVCWSAGPRTPASWLAHCAPLAPAAEAWPPGLHLPLRSRPAGASSCPVDAAGAGTAAAEGAATAGAAGARSPSAQYWTGATWPLPPHW